MMMLSDAPYFLLDTAEEPIDPIKVFGNDNPLYIEVGSGKGEFISGYPLYHPEWNFIGFEVRGKRIHNCLKKLSPDKHPNVRLVERLVDSRIIEILRAESISGAFIQHPDPWPKKKHHKRRLIQQEFLKSLSQILLPGAFVQVSTDHEEYANWIVDEFLQSPFFQSIYDDPLQEQPILDEHVVTWFEREQLRMGYKPNYMLFRKI